LGVLDRIRSAKQSRALDRRRRRGCSAPRGGRDNAKALLEAAAKASKESERSPPRPRRPRELADHADALVVSRELLVKGAEAERTEAEAETQLGVAKARRAPEADASPADRLDQAQSAAQPGEPESGQGGNRGREKLQSQREQACLTTQIADPEARKAKAEQSVKDARASVQLAQSGADQATPRLGALVRRSTMPRELKALERPRRHRAPMADAAPAASTPPAASGTPAPGASNAPPAAGGAATPGTSTPRPHPDTPAPGASAPPAAGVAAPGTSRTSAIRRNARAGRPEPASISW
jgi:hypothetical protein